MSAPPKTKDNGRHSAVEPLNNILEPGDMSTQCPMAATPVTVEILPAVEAFAPPVSRATTRFIPHVTRLKGEDPVKLEDVVARPDGLGVAFRDESPGDRDRRGALWVRTSPPLSGRVIPMFRQVHPRRAGEAMLDLRCQGCNGDPDRTRLGTLFFVEPDTTRRNLNWPDVEYTHHPPVCLPCVYQAMLVCPFVQRTPALRVRNPRPWGIDGIGYRLGADGKPTFARDIFCAYDDLQLLRWMVAIQPVARLSRCTVVNVRAELAAAGLEIPQAEEPCGQGRQRNDRTEG